MVSKLGIETDQQRSLCSCGPDPLVSTTWWSRSQHGTSPVLFFQHRRLSSCAFVSDASAGGCSRSHADTDALNMGSFLVPATCWHRLRLPFVLPARLVLKQPQLNVHSPIR